MIDYGLEPKLREVFDYLSKKASKAYVDFDMLSNETLSKNPFSSSFVRNYLNQDTQVIPVRRFYVLKMLMIYYIKNSAAFILYVINFFLFKLFSIKSKSTHSDILIDTFCMTTKTIKDDYFSDSYFLGLDMTLHKFRLDYTYLIRLYGDRRPKAIFKIIKILNKQNVPIITEFHILSVSDLFKIALFIVRYPFKVLRFINELGEEYTDKCLKKSIVDGLAEISFSKYSRFLQGKKLHKLIKPQTKILSWYENQAIDKNFYAGIRQSGFDFYIIGAQPLLFAKTYLSALVDEADIAFGCVPDKVLVNGLAYLPLYTSIKFEVGPSFRYKKLFESKAQVHSTDEQIQQTILILLSFDDEQNKNMLSCIEGFSIDDSFKFIIKPHQDLYPSSYVQYVSKIQNAKVLSGDFYNLLHSANIVVASSSGTLIEALYCGKYVLQYSNQKSFEYKILDGDGRGEFWDEFFDSDSFLLKMEKAKMMVRQDNTQNSAAKYYGSFFNEPTDDAIIRSLELQK